MGYLWRDITAPVSNSFVYQDASEAEWLEAAAAAPYYNGVWSSGDLYSFFQSGDPFYHSAGNLTLDVQVYYWNGSSWVLTNDTGWRYTTITDYTFYTESYVGLPYGAGYYGVQSYGYAWDGSWKGGTVWSGYQWFSGPAAPSLNDPNATRPHGKPLVTSMLPPHPGS